MLTDRALLVVDMKEGYYIAFTPEFDCEGHHTTAAGGDLGAGPAPGQSAPLPTSVLCC